MTAGVTAALIVIALAASFAVAISRRAEVPLTQPLPSVEPRIGPTIDVGPRGQVSAIASGYGSVWVAAYGIGGGTGIDQDAIVRIDPASNQVVDTIAVPAVPTWETGGGGLVLGFGSVWVGGGTTGDGRNAGLVTRIDPLTDTIASKIQLPDGVSDLAVNNSAVWVGTGYGGTRSAVARIDPTTERVTALTALNGDAVRHIVATDDAVMVQELVSRGGEGPCELIESMSPTDAHVIASRSVGGACSGGEIFGWSGQVWIAAGHGFALIDPQTAGITGPETPYTSKDAFPRSNVVVGDTGVWFGAYPGRNGEAPDRLSRFDPQAEIVQPFPIDIGWSAAAMLDRTIWAINWEGTVIRIDLVPVAPSQPRGTLLISWDPGNGVSSLAKIDVGTGARTTIDSDPRCSGLWVVSPDSSRVTCGKGGEGSGWIYIASLMDGAIQRQLKIPSSRQPRASDWSSDGKSILFTDNTGSLAVYDLATDRITEIPLPFPVQEARWSPTGDAIAVLADPDGPHDGDLLLTRPDGGGVTTVVHLDGSLSSLAWSPDGSRLALTALQGNVWQVFVVGRDGTSLTQLTTGSLDTYRPIWSPDGNWIAYESDTGGDHAELLVVSPAGGPAQVVTDDGLPFPIGWLD